MEQQSKRKTKFALLLVREKKDGTIRQFTVGNALIEATCFLLFIIIVAVTCICVYHSITIKNAKKEIIGQIVTINDLTDENEALTVENATLTSKITVLSETVSKKAATEDAISQEMVESALPKGFPLSGSATMEEAEEGDPMLLFKASIGINVVSSGAGVVVSVDADEVYGTKIVIDHQNGYHSIYRNNGNALVKNGEELGKGYILFAIGEENPELGYQIKQDDQYIDPTILIDING